MSCEQQRHVELGQRLTDRRLLVEHGLVERDRDLHRHPLDIGVGDRVVIGALGHLSQVPGEHAVAGVHQPPQELLDLGVDRGALPADP